MMINMEEQALLFLTLSLIVIFQASSLKKIGEESGLLLTIVSVQNPTLALRDKVIVIITKNAKKILNVEQTIAEKSMVMMLQVSQIAVIYQLVSGSLETGATVQDCISVMKVKGIVMMTLIARLG